LSRASCSMIWRCFSIAVLILPLQHARCRAAPVTTATLPSAKNRAISWSLKTWCTCDNGPAWIHAAQCQPQMSQHITLRYPKRRQASLMRSFKSVPNRFASLHARPSRSAAATAPIASRLAAALALHRRWCVGRPIRLRVPACSHRPGRGKSVAKSYSSGRPTFQTRRNLRSRSR
jgi:hypothetical protein